MSRVSLREDHLSVRGLAGHYSERIPTNDESLLLCTRDV
jgi:hypothetical protein